MSASSRNENDTIAAIASGTGPAGVGIIRISGPNAFVIADRLTRPRTPTSAQSGHTLRRARVYSPETNEIIDDGLLAVFHSPRSFTGENVVEFQGHGGAITLKRLFATILYHGARPANPGEFSERAFANGKIDLAQAEAIADMISAGTVEAHRAARRQVSGELSFALETCTDLLKESMAFIEASIDFPEEIGELDRPAVAARLEATRATLSRLLSGASYGRRLREGITIVLTGRPNVGKSSLLNALSGTDRAIVTPIPGTTRDVLEEQLNIAGVPVRALDTAGLRETTDTVEQIGVERARRAVADADIVIAVLDASRPLHPEEATLLASLAGRCAVIAWNKTDLRTNEPHATSLPETQLPIVPLSAMNGEGLSDLIRTLSRLVSDGNQEAGTLPLVTSARHEAALQSASGHLEQALMAVHTYREPELIAVDVFAAINALGEITGKTAREALIAGIFARFCIGK